MIRQSWSLSSPVLERPVEDTHLLAVITVTYNPDLEILARQLLQLPSGVLKVVVDNASRTEFQAGLRDVVARSGAELLSNDSNIGLAAALNKGCRTARQIRPNIRYLLLLDQDSEPEDMGVERLFATCVAIEMLSGKPCCVGPRLVDVATQLEHGFHQVRGWRWARLYPPRDQQEVIPISNLNGSGTLMSWSLFNELGGLEDGFFIDHVDTEWAFRVLGKGWELYAVPDVTFYHRMGVKSLRVWWFGWRLWPYRAPARHFYLFRNAGWLLKRDYVPFVWKFWAVIKLCMTFIVHALFDPERMAQSRNMLRGLLAACGNSPGRAVTPSS